MQPHKDDHSPKALFKSFKYAGEGILTALKLGRNLKVHFLATLAIAVLSLFLQISRGEYVMLLLTIGSVVCLEIVNSAIEETVDLVTLERNPRAKNAKDMAAGAVLIAAFIAVFIGIMIFAPYVKALLR